MTEAGAGARLRILSLDDDSSNRSLIRAVLTRADDAPIREAAVIEATTLAEARAILGRESVDLVLLDVHLPDGLGLDLATELHGRGAHRPAILALTASVLPADQQAALAAGCDAYLAKPFTARDLVSTIRRLIDQVASRGSVDGASAT